MQSFAEPLQHTLNIILIIIKKSYYFICGLTVDFNNVEEKLCKFGVLIQIQPFQHIPPLCKTTTSVYPCFTPLSAYFIYLTETNFFAHIRSRQLNTLWISLLH